MRIAYITSSLEGGGAILVIPAVTRVLRETGAQVEVFALSRRDGRALPSMLADGLQVHVREGGDRDHWSAYQWLDQKLAEYQPTLIWTSVARASIIGLLLGRRHKVPVVCWQHCAHLKTSTLLMYYALRKRAAMWVADSDIVRKITTKRFSVPAERIATWTLFATDPNAPQAQPWQPGQTLRIGSMGRLHQHKLYDVLIDALALLKQRGFVSPVPFEITIAGDGPDHDAIVQLIKRTGCNEVKLIGYVDRPLDFLADLHLYLQPSKMEGFCISVHEAMQAGLPVIASAVGQIPYTLEAGSSGWLVPPYDVNALADALADALSNPQQLAAMGQAARARVLPLYSKQTFRQAGESILERLHELGC